MEKISKETVAPSICGGLFSGADTEGLVLSTSPTYSLGIQRDETHGKAQSSLLLDPILPSKALIRVVEY